MLTLCTTVYKASVFSILSYFTMLCSDNVDCRLHFMKAQPSIFLFVWCARVRNSFSARTFLSAWFYGSLVFIVTFIWCTLVRLWIAFTFLFLLSDSILRLVSFILVYRYGICLALSCLVEVRNANLCLGTQSCGIRVRPGTHHVSHGSRGLGKHLLARSGFVELVPVVVHFPKLIWFLTFAVTCAPRGFERPKF